MANKDLEVALKIAAQTSGSKEIGALVNELDNIATSEQKAAKEAKELSQELTQLTQQQDLINDFQKSAIALEKHELATIAAARGLEKLQQEAQDTNKPFVQVARSLDAAEKDLAQMRSELTKNTSKHKALQKELKKTGVTTDNLTGKKRELAAGFKQVGKRVDTYTKKLKQGSAAERKHSQGLQNVTGNIVALTAGYIGLNQVSSAIKDIFSTGDKFERLGVTMEALMGSIAGGEQATAWVKEFTAKTPGQLSEVSDTFIKLKAFGLDPMNGTLQSITDQAFKLGGSFQEVEGISLAVGQAWAKQKLQGEEILQLIERGVPVWELLEKATGKNTLELQKLSSAGLLGRDTIKALIDEMGKQSVGAAAANMALLSGQISNAKDNIDNFYDRIANAGAMDYLKSQIDGLNKSFDEMVKDGRLQEWAQSVSDAIVTTAEGIKSTFSTIYEYRDEIALVAKTYLALKVGSYFTNVALGAKTAISSLVTYRAGIAATTTATKTATAATFAWSSTLKGALKGAGIAVALDFTIGQFTRVYDATTGLFKANADLEVSQQLLATQTNKMAAKLKLLSDQTGINITSSEQYFKLIDDGTIVFDKLTDKYINAAEQQRNLVETQKTAAAEEKQRQELTTLTLQQAIDTTLQLENQALSLNNVRGGVQGFITAIDSAKTTLSGAGEQYSQQVVLLDQLKAKYEAHNESLERQAFLAGDVNAAYKLLGIESSKALEELADKQRGAFELIQQSEEPLEQQRKAYLAWAESALKAADATGKTVPESVRAAAAALGLTKELEKLIETQQKLKPVLDDNSDAVNRFQAALDKTKDAIAQNEAVIKSATASAQSKAEAQKALIVQQARLTQETKDLTRVQKLENSTLIQLQTQKRKLTTDMENLNRRYQSGTIDATEYNDEKDRLTALLSVANDLLGDFSNATDRATNSTKNNTRAQKEANSTTEKTITSRRRLTQAYQDEAQAVGALESAWGNARLASGNPSSNNTSNYSSGNGFGGGASPETIVRFEDDNNIPEHLRNTSKEVADYRRENESIKIDVNKNFEGALVQLEAARNNSRKLDKLLATFSGPFGGLTASQVAQLKQIVEGYKNTVSGITKSFDGTKVTASYSNFEQQPVNQNTSSVSSADNDKLVSTIESLVGTLKSNTAITSTPKQTVRLDLMVAGETFKADLLEEFEDSFLNKLEQAKAVQ